MTFAGLERDRRGPARDLQSDSSYRSAHDDLLPLRGSSWQQHEHERDQATTVLRRDRLRR